MKILVTGGAGFIGSHLVEQLVKNGNDVTVVDNLSTGKTENLQNVIDKIEFIHLSVTNYIETVGPLFDFDQVYHLAASVGVKNILESPLECINNNIDDTRLLFREISNQIDSHLIKNNPRIFIASTSEVYGKNNKQQLSETDDRITGPTDIVRWVYAATKAMDEFVANIYIQKFNMDIVIGRFFNITGPRQSSAYGMVLPTFIEQAMKEEDITVYGDGEQIRSFMYIEDCLEVIDALMNGTKYCGVVNIGNPKSIMISDLAWRVRQLCNSNSKIVYKTYAEAYGCGFEDMIRRVPSIAKLYDIVGWDIGGMFRNINEIIELTKDYNKTKLENEPTIEELEEDLNDEIKSLSEKD